MTRNFLPDTLLACVLAAAAVAAVAQPASEPASPPATAGTERAAPGASAAPAAGPRDGGASAAPDAARPDRPVQPGASGAGRPAGPTLALALPATAPPAVRGAAGAPSPAAAAPPAPADATPAPGSGSITFIGTATVILRLGGYTILTDPNFLHKGEHAHLGYGLSTPRLTDPAMPIEQLPPIDLVVLSHYHGDHFDQVVERQLNRSVPIVTTPQAAAALRKRGFTAAQGLARWQSIEVTKPLPPVGAAPAEAPASRLRITAMPGRHGPAVVGRALPQTMGSLLEFGAGSPGAAPWRLYISGDTLVFDELREIPQRHPGIDLALLHLGGTRVLGMLVTMDAEQGVRLLQLLQPAAAIPIHYDDYPVFKSPLADFRRAVEQAGLADRVKYLQRGEVHRFTVGERR